MSAGSIEIVAIELAHVLEPLTRELAPTRAKAFFARLGITLTDAQVSGLSGPLGTASTRSGNLHTIARDITAAIASNNDAQLLIKGAEAITNIGLVIQSLDTIGAGAAAAAGMSAADVAKRLFDHLVFRRLEATAGLNDLLQLLGVLTRSEENEESTDPAHPPFTLAGYRFDLLTNWFSNPAAQAGALYGWGGNGFDGRALFAILEDIISRLGLPVLFDETGAVPRLDLALIEMTPKTDIAPRGLLIRLKSQVSTGTLTLPMGADAKMEVKAEFQPPPNTAVAILPDGSVSLIPPSPGPAFSGTLETKFVARRTEPTRPFLLFGSVGGSRLELGNLVLTTGARVNWTGGGATGTLRAVADANDLKLVIDTTSGDGFLQKILPGTNIEADFNLALGVSSAGFFFNGSSALEIQLPLHIGLGPISLQALTIGIKPQGSAIPITLGADVKGELGPLLAVVRNMGVTGTFTFPPNNSGNLGPTNLVLGFKPPTGVGLSLDVGIIKGGGFLSIDVDKGEYVGAMELDFLGIISLKAIAIINTKMPDGSSGFSLLIIITADFPPIQLGFGFTLNAVGGLLGLSRTVNIDALREGVRTNAIKSVLFPQDVIANITRIVSDLKQIFPPMNERFIVGPMAELGWGTPSIITLELGILIEIPVPRIAILGVLAAFLPAEELALLRIQVNFLGVIDFDNKYISFDASLFDSRLLIYTLTGDMAFRLSWGDNPMFILSVGGFHPAYHDAPQDLQHMTRLCISLLGGDNPRISVLSYFAVTSNTVQFGARAELYAEAAGFNVYGFIGYDVLFQFDPFKFIASFEAGLALRAGTDTIMGIHLAGQLSGINPWNARGDASITILFFDVSVSFNETWGDSADKIDPPKEDIIARLTAEINDNRNWRAEIPDSNNLHVSIRKIELPPDQLVIHPMGVLTFSERLVPLGLDITKFGNKVPLDAKRFDIKATDPGILTQTVTEEFAPTNFFDKNDSEKLSSPSFDRLTSGFKVTGASSLVMPTAVNKSVDYELTYLHKKRTQRMRAGKYKLPKHLFKASTKASAAAVSTLSYTRNRISVNAPDAVALEPRHYGVANVSDMRLAGPDLLARSYTEASQKYNALIARRPELKDQVQILAHHELNGD